MNGSLDEFENGAYHLKVYGPNGFYREFKGNANDPAIMLTVSDESLGNTFAPTGNIILEFTNKGETVQQIQITDNAYKTPAKTIQLKPGLQTVKIDTQKTFPLV